MAGQAHGVGGRATAAQHAARLPIARPVTRPPRSNPHPADRGPLGPSHEHLGSTLRTLKGSLSPSARRVASFDVGLPGMYMLEVLTSEGGSPTFANRATVKLLVSMHSNRGVGH